MKRLHIAKNNWQYINEIFWMLQIFRDIRGASKNIY